MNRRILFAIWFALLTAGIVHAQTACKWFTEGSAAALLNGPVTANSTLLPSGEGSCTFSLQKDTTQYSLEISVSNSAHGSCQPESQKLTGIGNEALLCKSSRSPGETVEEVNSRVRTTYFTVSLKIRGPSASAMSPAKQQDLLQQVAEQVAGNLY